LAAERIKVRLFNAVLVTAMFATPAHAQRSNGIDKHLENISGQYAQCAAYFRLVYHALMASSDSATATSYRQAEDTSMLYSLLAASEGRGKDLAVQVTNARIELYMKAMKREANNRNENISILINKYGDECVGSVNSPPAEVARLLTQRANESTQRPR
jgi:hypothetical protein